jgi:hypothetical protein
MRKGSKIETTVFAEKAAKKYVLDYLSRHFVKI